MARKKGRIIGLDIDEGSCIATELMRRPKDIYLAKYALAPNLTELTNDPFFKQAEAVISLPAQVVLFRTFMLPPSFLNTKNKEKDITAFISRQNLPFKLGECFWDTFVIGSNLNLVAVKNEVAQKYITQVEGAGLHVLGVTASLTALYNVLIYTYPDREKDRFSILNIRSSTSELLIYETKRLWTYPLSIGRADLKEDPQSLAIFSQEIQRIFNAHYLQNPNVALGAANFLYLSGQGCGEALIEMLKNVFSNFEIIVLDPFKNIGLSAESIPDKEVMALSLGLGITYFGVPPSLSINLIKNKIEKERALLRLDFLKKAVLFFLMFTAACLLLLDFKIFLNLKSQASIYQKTQAQVSSVLLEAGALKQEKEKLQRLKDYLENKLRQQGLHLKALAAIAQGKPQSIEIKELDIEIKDKKLQVFLAGKAPTYENVNEFLINLKKNEDIKGTKVVTSTFPALETEAKAIDFKLRFEIE